MIADLTQSHQPRELRRFLDLIDERARDELAVHVVPDNVGTHRAPEVQRWLQHQPRFEFHFSSTPTYSSSMNLLGRWFAEPTTKWLRRGAQRSTAELTGAVERQAADWPANPRPFVRHKTAEQIFGHPGGYLYRIPDRGR